MRLTRDQLYSSFGSIWRIHNRGFTHLLIECRKHFDGDLDQMLILSSIGERTFTEARARGVSYGDFVRGTRGNGPRRRINTQSIAESTGIPRETVRRKINVLVGRGWLDRCADGGFIVTDSAAEAMTSATEATFDYLLDIGNAMIDETTIAAESMTVSEPPQQD